MARKKKKPVSIEKLNFVLHVRISESDYTELRKLAEESPEKELSKFCRRLLLDSKNQNYEELKSQIRICVFEISKLSNQISQIEKNIQAANYPEIVESKLLQLTNRIPDIIGIISDLKERIDKEWPSQN